MAKLPDAPLEVTSPSEPYGLRLHAGELIGERYRVECVLGRGGMGVVYAAVHQHTGRNVALKIVECVWEERRVEFYHRFLGEARMAAALHHPNVVDVLDMGFHDGVPYLVMERLAGSSLEETRAELQIVPVATAIAWLLPVMGAVAALHERGIVHRDLKPANIFLSYDEAKHVVPKLLDFGLARLTGHAPITETGAFLGTPEYMAPERAAGREVGAPADVWSMGVVLFECLCGRVPFTAHDVCGIAAQVIAGEVSSARTANPSLPPAIADVIDRALSRRPEERHATMAELAYALGRAALSVGLHVPADPDPIGLPRFPTLLLENDPWSSGPLTRELSTAASRRDDATMTTETTQRILRPERTSTAKFLLLSIVPVLVISLLVALHTKRTAGPRARAQSSRAHTPALVHAPSVATPVPYVASIAVASESHHEELHDAAPPHAGLERSAEQNEAPREQRSAPMQSAKTRVASVRPNAADANERPTQDLHDFEEDWN